MVTARDMFCPIDLKLLKIYHVKIFCAVKCDFFPQLDILQDISVFYVKHTILVMNHLELQ